MQLRVKRIPTKAFLPIFTIINFVGGLILGAVVSVISLLSPEDQGNPMGVWSVIIFPFLNGFLGLLTGLFLTSLYNFLSPMLGGGLVLEVENEDEAVTLKNLS